MTWTTGLAPGLIGGGGMAVVAGWIFPDRLPAPSVVNHRGRAVPTTLGFALAGGLALALVFVAGHVFRSDHRLRSEGFAALWLLVSLLAVFAAGVYDDGRPSRVHGLQAHLAELGRGRVTSGIVKMLVAIGAATVAALALGARGWVLVLAIPLVAGVTNLCNLLDVAPGRTLKFGLLTSVILLACRASVLAWSTVSAAAILLPLDVRERGMLGDGGANTLGFALGVLLLLELPLWGLVIACGLVLILHGLAETVTLTRIIRRIAALRWLDDLGRIPLRGPGIG
jgi:UDP-N-acetylmuramyl pentapeptide phosphotransferase/UDP-N-acetylglucosamine-1-phosphate transferase